MEPKMDLTKKIRIGDELFHIRMVEDVSFSPLNLNKIRDPSIWSEVGTNSLGLEDGEWWPDSGDGDISFSVDEDDNVASSLGVLPTDLTKCFGNCKKQDRVIVDCDPPSAPCVAGSARA
ncbi:hypothetical protein TanjilG_00161 [Lupinus angustifolius]|uniref:Uncharacterized protein n=1 Tax=Lupinus angustifolius TaxID=3871 RepID=A0A1J7H5X3_LUPAN|nr:hypothetical protein TanjilG_00161 [Lupinus angustifolius]